MELGHTRKIYHPGRLKQESNDGQNKRGNICLSEVARGNALRRTWDFQFTTIHQPFVEECIDSNSDSDSNGNGNGTSSNWRRSGSVDLCFDKTYRLENIVPSTHAPAAAELGAVFRTTLAPPNACRASATFSLLESM